jgi:hypothetical protein
MKPGILNKYCIEKLYESLKEDLKLSSFATSQYQGTVKIARWHVPKPIEKTDKLQKRQCTQCAAPLPANRWTCEYCGTSFSPIVRTGYGSFKMFRDPDEPEPIATVTSCALTMSY